MTHVTTVINGHTVTVTGPAAQTLADSLQPAEAPAQTISKLDKARVTTLHACNAYLGHATGVLMAGGIECVIITADREHAQSFLDQFGATPGDARFSTPVAMVQRKDVAITPSASSSS